MCAHSEQCNHAVKLTSDVSRLDTLMGTHWRGGLKLVVMWMSLLAHGRKSNSDQSFSLKSLRTM